MNRIHGQTVLITGASSGIGRACAETLAGQGANLILTARRLDRLEAIREMLADRGVSSVMVRALDVRDRPAVLAFAEELAAAGLIPDALVNNAGLAAGLDKIQDGRFEDWDRMLDTNVKGLLNMTRALLPAMVARNRGHIVNIGSIAGRQAYPGGVIYNATKFAVRALTEGLNMDLLGTALRVSSVSPFLVETEFSRVRFSGDEERAKAVYTGLTPLAPRDVAEAVAWVLNAPPHVNILDVSILPTDQRSAYHVHRTGE